MMSGGANTQMKKITHTSPPDTIHTPVLTCFYLILDGFCRKYLPPTFMTLCGQTMLLYLSISMNKVPLLQSPSGVAISEFCRNPKALNSSPNISETSLHSMPIQWRTRLPYGMHTKHT